MVSSKQAKSSSIYQLKIALKGSRPPIWRRVLVNSNTTLDRLHRIIQYSMGWYNCHLHSFTIQGIEYGVPAPEFGLDDPEMEDEQGVELSKLIPAEKFKFLYVYDFGDSWDHEILVEKILEADPDTNYPICIKGKRACPPENCGGIWGYQEFLEAIRDPNHPEHESMLEWVNGEFDPEAFDIKMINLELLDINN